MFLPVFFDSIFLFDESNQGFMPNIAK